MKKLLILLLFPIVSFGQSPYTSYYQSDKIKVAGEGFNERIRHTVSAKSGLSIRESPDLKSKKLANIPYNTVLNIVD